MCISRCRRPTGGGLGGSRGHQARGSYGASNLAVAKLLLAPVTSSSACADTLKQVWCLSSTRTSVACQGPGACLRSSAQHTPTAAWACDSHSQVRQAGSRGWKESVSSCALDAVVPSAWRAAGCNHFYLKLCHDTCHMVVQVECGCPRSSISRTHAPRWSSAGFAATRLTRSAFCSA